MTQKENPPTDDEIKNTIRTALNAAIHSASAGAISSKRAMSELASLFTIGSAFNLVMYVFVIAIGSITTVVFFARLLHFVLSVEDPIFGVCAWLTKEQLNEIDKLFFSGSVGGIFTTFIRNKLGNSGR